MRQGCWALAWGLTALLASGVALAEDASEPMGLLLTWQQDPTTTMTIDWHTGPEDENPDPTLAYKRVGGEAWATVEAQARDFPHSDRTVHRLELTGLEPATAYRFRVGDFERTYTFETMPQTLEEGPVVFAAGGDARHNQHYLERMNREAMYYGLDFVVWGGDLAYADANPDRVDRWYEWFDGNLNTLITEEGRVVPILASIGNHEMYRERGGNYWYNFDDYEDSDEWREANAVFFFNLLASPGQPGYDVIDFGDYLSIVLLDSDHANPIEGAQTEWLEEVLAERVDRPHVFPVYHVPAYPSVRGTGSRTSTAVREHWVPLFEEYGVRVAFENHDHAYKRTVPIRDGRVDPTGGVVYIGDGAWGVSTRDVHDPEETWYLEEAKRVRHAIITTLDGPHQHFRMVSEDGEVIDEYPAAARSAAPLRDLLTLESSGANMVEAPYPDDGQWNVSQRGDSRGEYDVVTLDGRSAVRLHGLSYDGDRPRFRAELASPLANADEPVISYRFRARASEPTRLRSRMHGNGGTVTATQTHELDTQWRYISYTEEVKTARDYTETLKFSPDSDTDYENVEIFIDSIFVTAGTLPAE